MHHGSQWRVSLGILGRLMLGALLGWASMSLLALGVGPALGYLGIALVVTAFGFLVAGFAARRLLGRRLPRGIAGLASSLSLLGAMLLASSLALLLGLGEATAAQRVGTVTDLRDYTAWLWLALFIEALAFGWAGDILACWGTSAGTLSVLRSRQPTEPDD